MAFLHPISRMNGWILTKLVQLYCWDRGKNWLDLGDLYPIFKVTGRLRLLENGFSAPYLRNEWVVLTKLVQRYCWERDKNCTIILLCMEKNWLDFGDLDPIFKVTQELRLLKNGLSAPDLMKEWMDCCKMFFSAPYLQNEWMDFDQTCTAILLRQGQELITFWWPWPHFQVTLTKLVQLYCWDKDKNWLHFDDLDPIFKITLGLRFWKMAPIDHTHAKEKDIL